MEDSKKRVSVHAPKKRKVSGILKNKGKKPRDSTPEDINTRLKQGLENRKKNKAIQEAALKSLAETNTPKKQIKTNKDGKSAVWDEKNLKKNEDEKVPRMKIDEP